MHHVVRMRWRFKRSRIRGTATAPNSPREIMLGLLERSEPIHTDIASKSNVIAQESGMAYLARGRLRRGESDFKNRHRMEECIFHERDDASAEGSTPRTSRQGKAVNP